MGRAVRAFLLLCCVQRATFTDPECIIELPCAECVPEHMPAVSARAGPDGRVRVAPGDELTLSCGDGAFARYPLRRALAAACEAGRYRVRHDGALRHLLELGCQENIFEDVLHPVEHCSPPLQGRAYRTQAGAGVRHVATVCFDADRAVAVHAHASSAPLGLRAPPHAESRAPLSLLGNFNHMFDASTRAQADKLYSDDLRTNRRLHELFKHDRVPFAGQALTAGKLLSARYFGDQDVRVSDFASNKVPVWSSVAEGNLHHLHKDIGKLMRASRPNATLDVYAGVHGVMSLRTGRARSEVFLSPERFPVPRYVWAVVHDARRRRALAVALLNDPFVAVSEVRDSVFCESACGAVPWLHELRRDRRYEVPLYGLVFCCALRNFTDVVTEAPRDVFKDVPDGDRGMLLDFATLN